LGEELSPKTTGILLARLEEKGYLRPAPGPALTGRVRPPHFYTAVVTREQSLRWQLEKFFKDHLIDDPGLTLLEALSPNLRSWSRPPPPAPELNCP
jgi:hypothetical protein